VQLSEDMAQDMLGRVLLKLSREMSGFQFDRSRGRFRSWLKTIVVRRVCDAYRRADEEPMLLGDAERWLQAPDDDVKDGEAELECEALWAHGEWVHARVESRVKPTSWTLFWKVEIEGVALSLAARELGLNYSNALKRLKQVRDSLRREGERLAKAPAGVTDRADY
jgi:RNA polymerase sigma-70 factor (ECF subfamily)